MEDSILSELWEQGKRLTPRQQRGHNRQCYDQEFFIHYLNLTCFHDLRKPN